MHLIYFKSCFEDRFNTMIIVILYKYHHSTKLYQKISQVCCRGIVTSAKLWLVQLWSCGSTNLAIQSQSQKFHVSVASHLNRLLLIICTWLESPKVVLYAGTYCKLVACTVVELWQHKNQQHYQNDGKLSNFKAP